MGVECNSGGFSMTNGQYNPFNGQGQGQGSNFVPEKESGSWFPSSDVNQNSQNSQHLQNNYPTLTPPYNPNRVNSGNTMTARTLLTSIVSLALTCVMVF